jgi:DNA polymerase III epsilon subunit-like protein
MISHQPLEVNAFPLIRQLAQQLAKPVCVFDIETTGLPYEQVVGIVEFGCITVDPNGTTFSSTTRINPGIPIPWQATKVHGIRNRDVAKAPKFTSLVPTLTNMFSHNVVAGFNTREFDVPIILRNGKRYDIGLCEPSVQLDVRDIWAAHQRSLRGKLNEVAEYYSVTIQRAHCALDDALATAQILEAMLGRHGVEFVLTALSTPAPVKIHRIRSKKVATKAATPKVSDTSVAPSNTANSPKTESKSALARRHILARIHENGHISRADYQTIATKISCAPSTVSIEISNLFAQGEIQKQHIMDHNVQRTLDLFLSKAIAFVGAIDRLKPIKEKLDQMTGQDIDYVQLRIAMADRNNTPLRKTYLQKFWSLFVNRTNQCP